VWRCAFVAAVVACAKMLEKVIYTIPVVVLYVQGQAHPKTLAPALIDPVFGILFVIAYVRTRETKYL